MKKLYDILDCKIEVSADFQWQEKESLKAFVGTGNPELFLTLKKGISKREEGLKRIGKEKWIDEWWNEETHGWTRTFTWEETPEVIIRQLDASHWILEVEDTSFDKFMKMDFLNFIPLERFINQKQGMILHAALVNWEEQGILFTGPSGIGKTTQASLWEECQHAKILNGDKSGIRKKDDMWVAYGLPYAGSSHIYMNESVPIRTIVVLQQAQENRIQRLERVSAFSCLYKESTTIGWDKQFLEVHVDVIGRLVQEIPVYLLECTPDLEAVKVLENELTQQNNAYNG